VDAVAAQSPLPDLAELSEQPPSKLDIAAIDMFVVATATFQLLYALIVLNLDRRRVVHFEVTPNPTQDWLSRQMTEAFPWDTAPRYLLPGPRQNLWPGIPSSRPSAGDHGGHHCAAISVAEPVR
jgi:hypothetical protein